MSNSYFLKQEKQSFFELLKQLELNPMIETLLVDAYQRGYKDGVRYTKDNSSRQVQHGGGSEQISFIFGEPPQQESSVSLDRKDPER